MKPPEGYITLKLSPEQAAWSPAPGRHSIWQSVNHVCIWREFTLTKIDGRPGPAREDMEPRNFESPATIDTAAWAATIARLRRTHEDCRDAIAAPPEAMSGIATARATVPACSAPACFCRSSSSPPRCCAASSSTRARPSR